MTYPNDFTVPSELLEQVQEQGLNVLPELIRVIINTAMLAERREHLNAGPYQHTVERRGYANGFKPKTMQTRVGEIPLIRCALLSLQVFLVIKTTLNREILQFQSCLEADMLQPMTARKQILIFIILLLVSFQLAACG